MSDSSDDEFSEEWVPYSCRPEFKDVKPLPQDDGDYPVACINYSPRFREVYDYVRAIMVSQEKSPRALELTKDALRFNPANYTVWQYRRDILKALGADLKEELDYVEEVIKDNVKNYQVWYHRRVLVEILNDPSRELELTEYILNLDAKNYHAWQHRQWAIKTYNLFDEELAFAERLISEDIRNNSAWNERFFVCKNLGFTPEVILREINYTMNRIELVKNNESAWNYLVGVLKQDKPFVDCETLNRYPAVVAFAKDLFDKGIRSPYLLAFLIDVYKQFCLKNPSSEEGKALARQVYSLCSDLSKKYDVIRRNYWQYVADQFQKKLSQLP